MTYATKQLTHALQELTSRSQNASAKEARPAAPQVIAASQLQFSKEVEDYLQRKHAYSQSTRNVSVGSY